MQTCTIVKFSFCSQLFSPFISTFLLLTSLLIACQSSFYELHKYIRHIKYRSLNYLLKKFCFVAVICSPDVIVK